MSSPAALPRIEEIIDGSAAAPRIEALLPAGARHRQLKVRTLLTGMMLTQADRRPAHLTEVHAALTALTGPDQARLGVTEDWDSGPHQLTYRQVERTFGLMADALAKDQPGGTPSATLTAALDDLLEASIPPEHKDTSTALAVDWTDVESFSRPPHHGSKACADPEASWGHRTTNLPGPKGEMFFGYGCTQNWPHREPGMVVVQHSDLAPPGAFCGGVGSDTPGRFRGEPDGWVDSRSHPVASCLLWGRDGVRESGAVRGDPLGSSAGGVRGPGAGP